MKLILGVHNHQPVGNFDHVIAEVYRQSYLPFLERLEAHPDIRLCMHHSGPLWEWLEDHHPEYLERMASLVAADRVEVLGGAFYEPILPAIPEADRRGQIRMMSDAVRNRFGSEVQGLWLAERVWEPQITSSLAAAGIRYVLLDDYHFIQSGLSPDALTERPLLTEELGSEIALFPISEKLRYFIPFREPEETIALCRALQEADPGGMLVMVDDGEKFGAWPETHDWVYTKGWLERFFTALAAEQDWLELVHPQEALSSRPPRRRVYLPPGCYFEMTEWALPVPASERFTDLVAQAKEENRWDELRPFLRGGFWRQFLQRYDESALMYHRSLLLHHDILAAESQDGRRDLTASRRALWRGQCNCAYWHGIFGGLYLPHLRHALCEQFIRGTEALETASARAGVTAVAIMGGPHWDLRLVNRDLELYLSPAHGASCVLLEDRRRGWNLQNTLRRRREAYHRKMESIGTGSPGSGSDHASIHDRGAEVTEELRQALAVDSTGRYSLLDRLVHPEAKFEDVLADMAATDGGDFAEAAFGLVTPGRDLVRTEGGVRGWHEPGPAGIVCGRSGHYRSRNGDRFPVHLHKRICLAEETSEVRVQWTLRNDAEQVLACRFGAEWNLALLKEGTLRDEGNSETVPLEPGSFDCEESFVLQVPHYEARLAWRYSEPGEVWVHEICTVSQAESGFELNYQGHMFLFLFPLALAPGGEWTLEAVLTLAGT